MRLQNDTSTESDPVVSSWGGVSCKLFVSEPLVKWIDDDEDVNLSHEGNDQINDENRYVVRVEVEFSVLIYLRNRCQNNQHVHKQAEDGKDSKLLNFIWITLEGLK